MSAISRSDGSTHSIDTKMAWHVTKAAGERKHGTVSSKRREVQKAELGIASPHSNLNPGCFRTVGGPFGTWSGAPSGLGFVPFRDLVGVLSHGFIGVLSGAHRGERKTTSEKYKASTACTLIFLVDFAHTRRAHTLQK